MRSLGHDSYEAGKAVIMGILAQLGKHPPVDWRYYMSKINKKAWSNYFKSYIVCVKYISDTNWYFYLLGNKGRVLKAQTAYSYFDWQDL